MTMRPVVRFILAIVAICVAGGVDAAESSFQQIDRAIATANYGQAMALIDSQLAATPGDPGLRMRRARVHGYVGDYDAALSDLDALRQEHPYDVDYALARGRIFARQGRDAEALDDLRQAALLAPDYEAVWKLRYSVLARQQDEPSLRERETVQFEAAARFPRASWWREPATESVGRWTVLVGAGHEDLDNDLPSWGRQFIEVGHDYDRWGRYRAGVARDERFDSSDISLLLGGEMSFGADWFAGLDLTFVDQANFLPDFSFAAYAGRTLQKGWGVNLRYGRREYQTATVGTVTSSVEKYVGDFRVAYALGLSHLHGESNFMNHSLTVNWYYNARSSVGINLNTGEEAESVIPGVVLETDVRGVSLTGRRDISERMTLHWWLGLHDQGDFYRRQYLGMAVSLRL